MARRAYVNSRLTASQQRRPKTRSGRWLARLTTLHWALLASLAVHAILLSVRFVDPERFNRLFKDTPLEVVLVNARSQEAPLQAQAIAQANLAGGGEALSGRATSPLPPRRRSRSARYPARPAFAGTTTASGADPPRWHAAA
jgi:hypothetical protein